MSTVVLLVLGIALLGFAAIDGYQAVTGKRLFDPPAVDPAEGEEPKAPKTPEQQKQQSTIAAAAAAVAGIALIVIALVA